MKTITFLIAFVTASAALVVPPSTGDPGSPLTARDDAQQLKNPDGEAPYTDEITGASIAKSMILSGVGPPEADDRFFDWDESCTDENHRRRITLAFRTMQELATSASGKLQELKENLPQQPSNTINNENRLFIARTDFAYTQMFRARDNDIGKAKDSFDRLTENAKNFPGRAAAGEGALRFICNADNHVRYGTASPGYGAPLCGDAENKATRVQAVTFIPQNTNSRNIEQRYSFTNSASITFCPAFFDDNEFPNLEDIIGYHGTEALTLDQVNCTERILLHEYMHLPWVDSLPGAPDTIGYVEAAKHTKEGRRWDEIADLPDAFAWYALYSYFNNVDGGCGDAWPPRQKKPVVIT